MTAFRHASDISNYSLFQEAIRRRGAGRDGRPSPRIPGEASRTNEFTTAKSFFRARKNSRSPDTIDIEYNFFVYFGATHTFVSVALRNKAYD